MNPNLSRRSVSVLLYVTCLALLFISTTKAQYVKKVIAFAGQDAPGIPGAKFSSSFPPIAIGLSDSGKALFQATLETGIGGITADNNEGIWVYENDTYRLLIQKGGPINGFPQGQLLNGQLATVNMSQNGQIGMHADYSPDGTFNNSGEGFFMEENGVWVQKLFRNMIFPSGDTLSGFSVSAFNEDRVLFGGVLTGPTVAGSQDAIIAVYGPEGINILYQSGKALPGVSGGWVFVRSGGQKIITAAGKTVFEVQAKRIADNKGIGVVYSWDPVNGHVPLRVSGLDSTFVVFGSYRLNTQGNIISRSWDVFPSTYGLFDTNDQRIVGGGDIAPGSGGLTFGNIFNPVLFDNDNGMFQAGTSDNNLGIWGVDGSGVTKIVRVGDPAPPNPNWPGDFRFFRVNNMDVNRKGQVAFSDLVVDPVTGSAYVGVWIGEINKPLELIIESDERIEVLPDSFLTIESAFIVNAFIPRTGADGFSEGFQTGLNNNGTILLSFTVNEGFKSGLLIAERGGLVVNSVGDLPDLDITDGRCDTGDTLVTGEPECTLRAAIMEANRMSGLDTIKFDIKEKPAIVPLSPLPVIGDSVVIDGFSQPGELEVLLDGRIAGPGAAGLRLEGSGIIIQELDIARFFGNGIEMFGNGFPGQGGGNKVYGCVIGYVAGDGSDFGNGLNGISLELTRNTTIGGPLSWQRNEFGKNGTNGIALRGCDNIHIENNLIGFEDGQPDAGNSESGISIKSSDSVYVGRGDAGRNVIRGNNKHGVYTELGSEIVIDGNRIASNFFDGVSIGKFTAAVWIIRNNIGLKEDGNPDGNVRYGVLVNEASTDIFVGGATDSGNVISDNSFGGVRVRGTSDVVISGNHIGVDKTGLLDRGNLVNGIMLDGSNGSRIGKYMGSAISDIRGAGNVISGNDSAGILIVSNYGPSANNTISSNLIGVGVDSTTALPNTWGVVINNSSGDVVGLRGFSVFNLGNVISKNQETGVVMQTCFNGAVGSNHVLENGKNGITQKDCSDTDILYNRISGNREDGIFLDSSGGVRVDANIIGLDEDGSRSGNFGFGIVIHNSLFANFIGGPFAMPNVISDNGKGGVKVVSSNEDVISGNFIGLDSSGMLPRGNRGNGILLDGCVGTLVGEDIILPNITSITSAGQENVISGNDSAGIKVVSETDASRNIHVSANLIGVGVDTTTAIPNLWGVVVESSPRTFVGSDLAEFGNFIQENKMSGIVLSSDTCEVRGNTIIRNGFGKTEPVGLFGGDGVYVDGTRNTIGSGRDLTQVISDNNGVGVRVVTGAGAQNRSNGILENSIFGNALGGIDIDPPGPNANDLLDADGGPNDGQNHPEILSVVFGGANQFVVRGILRSEPNGVYLVEVYANDACDPSELGQGKTLIGEDIIALDGSGEEFFTITTDSTTGIGSSITLTATDFTHGNTSEFSNCATVLSERVDLVVSKSDGVDSVSLSDAIRYEISVANHGIDTATGVTLIDTLPTQISYVTDTSDHGPCVFLNGRLTCDLGKLAPGDSATVILIANPNAAGLIENRALAFAAEGDINPLDNVGVDSTIATDFQTAVGDDVSPALPQEFSLSQNHPNPFNPVTVISYALPKRAEVTITIYNILGQSVRTIEQGTQSAGRYSVTWNADNDRGIAVSSGMYFYRLKAGSFVQTRKMILMK